MNASVNKDMARIHDAEMATSNPEADALRSVCAHVARKLGSAQLHKIILQHSDVEETLGTVTSRADNHVICSTHLGTVRIPHSLLLGDPDRGAVGRLCNLTIVRSQQKHCAWRALVASAAVTDGWERVGTRRARGDLCRKGKKR